MVCTKRSVSSPRSHAVSTDDVAATRPHRGATRKDVDMPTIESILDPAPSPPASARELEAIVRRLCATEPDCSLSDRASVLTQLESIRRDIERLILRHETCVESTPVLHGQGRDQLVKCADRLRRLLVHWPEEVTPYRTAAAA